MIKKVKELFGMSTPDAREGQEVPGAIAMDEAAASHLGQTRGEEFANVDEPFKPLATPLPVTPATAGHEANPPLTADSRLDKPASEVDHQWFERVKRDASRDEPLTEFGYLDPSVLAQLDNDPVTAGAAASGGTGEGPAADSGLHAGERSPAAPAPPPLSPPPPADAFAVAWAAEQGEALPPVPAPTPPFDLSDASVNAVAERLTESVSARVADGLADRLTSALADRVVDRLAKDLAERVTSGVAERLARGLAEQVAAHAATQMMQNTFGDSLRGTVHDVAERLVREEIARIRAAAKDSSSSGL